MADFIGRGFDFPLQLGGDGKFRLVTGNDKIKASLRAILSTPVGERIMNREFGCRIHEINFENQTPATTALAQFYVMQAIQRWEPRITVEDDGVEVAYDEADVYISITYTINESNTEDNVVFPYAELRGAA